MENEEIASVKTLINSLEADMKNLKAAMKSGDESAFNNSKSGTLDDLKKIEDILNKKNNPQGGLRNDRRV